MPTPTAALVLPLFCAALFSVAATSAQAQGQASEIQLRAPEGEALQVRHITGRFYDVERDARGTTFTTTTNHRDLCLTPCRFVLNQPMELAIQDSNFHVQPEGGIQRFQITPARPGLRVLSAFATSVSAAAIGFGGSVLYYRSENELDMPGLVRGARLGLALGIPFLIASVIGLVRSRTRVTRVDRFEF